MTVTAFWGIANVVAGIALTDISSIQLNAIRFVIAFSISYLFFYKKMRPVSKATLKASLLIGLILSGVYIFATEALLYTDVTNVGFLLSLHVIMVPAMNRVARGIKTGPKLLFCVIISFIGLAFLTIGEGGSSFRIRLGDWFAFFSSVLYSLDMIFTEIYVAKDDVDPLQLGVLQLGVVAVAFSIAAAIGRQSLIVSGLRPWLCILFLSIFATAMPFILQPIAQRLTSVTRVGLIFSAEPLFTTIAAYIILNERLHYTGYIGAAIMLLALVVMNINIPGLDGKQDA